MSWEFVSLLLLSVVCINILFGEPPVANANNALDQSSYEPYIPQVRVVPEPAIEGNNVTFQCFAYYEIGFDLFPNWSLPETNMAKRERVEINKSITVDTDGRKGVNTMVLHHVTRQDEGDYTCLVIDLLGNQYQKTYSLKISAR